MMSAIDLSKGEDAVREVGVMTLSGAVSDMAGDEVQVLETPSMDNSMPHGTRAGYVKASCMYEYATQASDMC